MACTLERPCSPVVVVLRTQFAILRECLLGAHSFREELPVSPQASSRELPPDDCGPCRMAKAGKCSAHGGAARRKRPACQRCKEPMTEIRQGSPTMHLRCRILTDSEQAAVQRQARRQRQATA